MSPSRRDVDVVVVGAGPAGAVCAARLVEAGHDVLLFEAGPGGENKLGRDGLVPPDNASPWFWPPLPEITAKSATSRSTGQSTPDGVYWAGRGLGGGSAVNGMVLSAGSAADYDRWAEVHGCTGWNGADMAPWIHKAVDVVNPELFAVAPGDDATLAVADGFDRAAQAMGWSTGAGSTLDPEARGVLVPALASQEGRRRSIAAAYLHHGEQQGLTVRTGSVVDHVQLSARCVTGVRLGDGEFVSAPVVVAAAGAIGSPRLLYRSGLRSGVGLRVKNHPSIAATFPWPKLETAADRRSRAPAVCRVLRFDLGAPAAASDHRGRTTANRVGEIHLIGPFGVGSSRTGLLLAILQDPTSVGFLEEPGSDAPRLVTNRLGTDGDRLALRSAVRVMNAVGGSLTDELGVAPSTASGGNPILLDELADFADHDLDQWMRSNHGPTYHAVATCRMGATSDDGSCVDSNPESAGAVWGVQGLVVADTSIFPDLVSGGLQLPATAVAERVSAGLVSRLSGRRSVPA